MLYDAKGSWSCVCPRGALRLRLQVEGEILGEGRHIPQRGKHAGNTHQQIYDAHRGYGAWVSAHAHWPPSILYAKYAQKRHGFDSSASAQYKWGKQKVQSLGF